MAFIKKISPILVIATVIAIVSCTTVYTVEPAPRDREVVVLLHGFGRSNSAMWLLGSRLERAGYYVQRVGYTSLRRTPDEILREVSVQIDTCCRDHPRKVHFVGHSLGGLMIRAYLQNNRVSNLGRVVLIGTPNKGTAAADRYHDNWLMKIFGPTARAMGTDEDSFPNSLQKPYYPVGVIAGMHDNAANDSVLPGRDDGLVPVEATKLEGMTDFWVVETGHSMLRYNEEVAGQTVAFLKNGKFSRNKKTD